MSKENKKDRLVRNMFDHISDHLHELKALEANQHCKESDVERWVQSILRVLGFTATEGYSIRVQEGRGKLRPDLVIYQNDKPKIIIEVKKLGFDLNKSNFRSGKVQLREYLSAVGGVTWGILCNGYEWRLFDFSDPTMGIEILDFDLRSEPDEGSPFIDTTKRGVDEACYSLVDLHERTFRDDEWKEWSKEATAFSPDSLVKAVLSLDVMKRLAKSIKGEYEYKVNLDILADRMLDLLEKGLDDAMLGWNETKRAELFKYVKSQKRANKRKVKERSSSSDMTIVSLTTETPNNNNLEREELLSENKKNGAQS